MDTPKGKKIEVRYEKTAEFEKSYTGTSLESFEIRIGVYDRNCGSPSCVEIRMSEMSRSKKGRYMVKTILHSLPREKAIELKKAFNAIQL